MISSNPVSGTYLPSDFCRHQLAGGGGKTGRKNEERTLHWWRKAGEARGRKSFWVQRNQLRKLPL